MGIVILIGKFEFELNEDGLRYRFLPKFFTWKFIPKDQIESIEVREPIGLMERFACGYKRRLFRKSVFMNIAGTKFVIVSLMDGHRIKMGSMNAEAFGYAFKRLLNSNEI